MNTPKNESDNESLEKDNETDVLKEVHNYFELQENLQIDYETLSPESLNKHMSQFIEDVNQIIDLPQTLIRLLFERFRWDKDVLCEKYLECGYRNLFIEARIMPNSIGPDGKYPSIKMHSFNEVEHRTTSRFEAKKPCQKECDICCVPCVQIELLAVGCNHYYCRDCWVTYLKCKIIDENQGNRICCPSFNCENLIDDTCIFALLPESRVRKRFQKHIARNFVLQNQSLTWCPGVDCDYAVRSFVGNGLRQVTCANCSDTFCFSCGNPWHEPVLCSYLITWNSHVNEEIDTSNWLVANTKECPKCHAKIEKNGGCNRIRCTNSNCAYEFCWMCMKMWKLHATSYYNCNSYNYRLAKVTEKVKLSSKTVLDRYFFYVDRFSIHAQSRKFDSKLYESVNTRISDLQSKGMSWIDGKFVKQVVDVLCECRRTLMYSYVFAFYLEKNNQALIFEENQKDLEQATEQLSEYFEWDLHATVIMDLKQKLLNQSQYCENRRRALLDHVQEGYEKNMWLHTSV